MDYQDYLGQASIQDGDYWSPTPCEADWSCPEPDIWPSRGWPASTMDLRASRAPPPRAPNEVEHRQRRVKRQVWRRAS